MKTNIIVGILYTGITDHYATHIGLERKESKQDKVNRLANKQLGNKTISLITTRK